MEPAGEKSVNSVSMLSFMMCIYVGAVTTQAYNAVRQTGGGREATSAPLGGGGGAPVSGPLPRVNGARRRREATAVCLVKCALEYLCRCRGVVVPSTE